MAFDIASNVSQVLWVCERAEFACAELYHYFASLFKDDRRIFYLWLKTALEEENRGRLFALVAKLRHDNIIESVELELAEAEETLQHVHAVLERVKESPPTSREALEIGMELEAKFDRLMMENVVNFADESFYRTFVALLNHKPQESLREAYQQLGTS